MNWSPLQREALDAMGLSPYRLATTAPVDAPATLKISEPVARERAAKAGAIDTMDTITAALLRAAGLGAEAGASEVVLAVCPVPQALRGDASAKRALWPRLRALRRG